MPNDTPDTIVVNLTRHEMTPGIRSFLAEYKAMTFDHPFDPRERVWSYASNDGERLPLITTALSFTPYHAAPVWFQTISSPEGRGKGQASYVLREITRLADKHGVAIWLTPKPFGKLDNALRMSDLKAWYTRHGWVRQGSVWVRQPITARVASRWIRVAGDTWYHITDKANFRLNPKYAPRDNSISIEDRSGRSGIYLARDIEPWLNGHGYWRPFVAEFDVDPTVRDDPGVHGRWGGEMFVPAASFDKLHLKRVIPLDAWARERYGLFGWVEEQVGRRFDTGDAIQFGPGRRSIDPPRGYRYPGPDVRQMSPEDVKRLKSDLREFRRTRTAATVAVDPAHIDQLRRDVLMIARAADNVASLGDIDRVTRAVRAWRDRWDTFAFTLRQDLESRIRSADRPYDPKYNPNPPDKATAEYYLDRALAPMWDFDSELNRKPRTDTELKDTYGNPWRPPEEVFEDTVRFYLERGYAASRDEAVSEARRYHDRRPPSTREEAEAAAVARWKAEAVKWTRRLRDKARKAWDTLNGYVAWLDSGRGGSRPLTVIHPEEEVVPLAGFRVVFRGFAESEYQDKLGAVREGLERYRRYATARAPVILRHTPPIFVEWTFEPTTRGDAAGYYAYNGRVNITPWVIGDDVDRFVKTLAHEVGHHLAHTFLSKDAFAAWSRFVRGDYRDLDLREALAVMDRLGARSVIDKVLMVEDPILHLQLSTLMHDPSYSRRDFLFADNIRAYLDGGGNPVVRVPVHPITGYAGKNAEEAFCEAVGNLVAYGPKAVPDVVLGMLRSVMGGGVRIASTRTAAPSIPTARIG